MAEGFLRAKLGALLGPDAPGIVSAGIIGWEGSGPDPSAVEAAAERGIDISGHRARRLRASDVAAADLVIAMAPEQAEAVLDLVPAAASRTFTLKELVRLLEALPASDRGPVADLSTRVLDANGLRQRGFQGNPHDDDVPDPLGMPFETFRAIAWELDGWCSRLVEGLYGGASVHAGTGMGESGDR
jgi:protein-tyrosine-phosphatase